MTVRMSARKISPSVLVTTSPITAAKFFGSSAVAAGEDGGRGSNDLCPRGCTLVLNVDKGNFNHPVRAGGGPAEGLRG